MKTIFIDILDDPLCDSALLLIERQEPELAEQVFMQRLFSCYRLFYYGIIVDIFIIESEYIV
ncbi:MAG: hypothetical protein BWX81_01543 [Spirochaetes bacterium ADurb.Bin110]|nr:MAG: hypothetical protein BWX81_01543 [Spirochaetes bacterium ADurb.Bin110]